MKKWILAISVFASITIIPELILRAIGFHYDSGVINNVLRPSQVAYFEPDDDLFWKYPVNQPGVNSFGFRGKEISIPKPQRVKRLLFLGDSCTDQEFPDLVEMFLNENSHNDSVRYECVRLAAPGYSSYQGKVLACKYAGLLDADMVFIFFGWNDHWLAYGCNDESAGSDNLRKILCGLFHYSKIYQAGLKALYSIADPRGQKVLNQVRVSELDYKKNLVIIDSVCSEYSVPVVFITAPTDHTLKGVPHYLIELKLAPNPEFVLNEHQKYCSIVRNVAKSRAAYLLDLEKEFNRLTVQDSLFMSDGIHFTRRGSNLVAIRICLFLEQKTDLISDHTFEEFLRCKNL